MKNKKQKGFTLIELLAVIAIIGIISTIAIVNLRHARNEAYIAAVQETINIVNRAATACLAQDGILMANNTTPCGGGTTFTLGEEMCDGIRWPIQLHTGTIPVACVYSELPTTCADGGTGGCYLIFFGDSEGDVVASAMCAYNWLGSDGCWVTPA